MKSVESDGYYRNLRKSHLDEEFIDRQKSDFYSWECISLFRKGGTTLDFVVPD